MNLPVPGLFGNGAPIQNAGKVETRGWELSVSYRLKTGPVVHNFSGNISDSFNEVIDTRGTEIIGGSDVQTIIKEGYPCILIMHIVQTDFSRMRKNVRKDRT